MPRYRVLKDGEVLNRIQWCGHAKYDPGEGCTLELDPDPVGVSRHLDDDTDDAIAEDEDILFNPTDDISEKQALEAALAQKAEELAIANARIAELEARVEVPAAVEWPDLNDKLSDWDEVGHGAIASNIPAGIAELMEPGETLTHDVRRKLTERLNVELAELKNLRGLAGEDLKREAEIEKLLGLFARLGEI